MAYISASKNKKASIDVKVFGDVEGLGLLPTGHHKLRLESRKEYLFTFATLLPGGCHIEHLPTFYGAEVGGIYDVFIGFDQNGHVVRRNKKGEYAFVLVSDKTTPVSEWYATPMALLINTKLSNALPSIGRIERDGKVVYENTNII